MLGRGCDWHGATSHGAFLPPCRNKCKRYMKINAEAPTEPSPLQRAPEDSASPSSSVLLPQHQHCSWHHSSTHALSHSPEHPIRCPTQSPLSFLSSLLLPPCGFFPCSCFQGERGQHCRNERFSCVPSPSSGPNSFFMAPCSDKSRCFSLVSVRHAISQS